LRAPADCRSHLRPSRRARRAALPAGLSAAGAEGRQPLGCLLGGRQVAGSAPMTTAPTSVLEVRDLKKYFPVRRGWFGRQSGTVYAVDGIAFSLAAGQTLGLVGESGC